MANTNNKILIALAAALAAAGCSRLDDVGVIRAASPGTEYVPEDNEPEGEYQPPMGDQNSPPLNEVVLTAASTDELLEGGTVSDSNYAATETITVILADKIDGSNNCVNVRAVGAVSGPGGSDVYDQTDSDIDCSGYSPGTHVFSVVDGNVHHMGQY